MEIRTFDVVVLIFLIVGGLNWGLVGVFNFDLVATIFGQFTAFSRIVYILVGLSALYEVFALPRQLRRWAGREEYRGQTPELPAK